jgi:hypothetical protein
MHNSAPIPPDPESERRGHELRDVAIKPILIFLILLFVFGGVLQAVMSLIMDGLVIPEAKIGVPSYADLERTRQHDAEILDTRFRDYGDTTRAGDLQRDTTKDMQRMYEEDDAVLYGYGINPKTKKVHIPITLAMKKVIANKLLKSREGSKMPEQDLPYPTHSLPYKSTP